MLALGCHFFFPLMGLATMTSAFSSKVTMKPFSRLQSRGQRKWTRLHRWLVHFQFHTYPEKKKMQLAMKFLSDKALLSWKEFKPQSRTWADFEQVFRKGFLKEEANYDIVGNFQHLDILAMRKLHYWLSSWQSYRMLTTC